MSKKVIMWEKFENYVNKHIDISRILVKGGALKTSKEIEEQEFEAEDDEGAEESNAYIMAFPVTEELLEGVRLTTNFDCWMGHCNFPLTNALVLKLNETEGIEYLEILSKYRFMIGLGQAFTLKDVRANIQRDLGVTANG